MRAASFKPRVHNEDAVPKSCIEVMTRSLIAGKSPAIARLEMDWKATCFLEYLNQNRSSVFDLRYTSRRRQRRQKSLCEEVQPAKAYGKGEVEHILEKWKCDEA